MLGTDKDMLLQVEDVESIFLKSMLSKIEEENAIY